MTNERPAPAVELDQVGKRYWKLEEAQMRLRSILPRKRQRTELWSLRAIDLTLERGETVGVIGRNGAGKTTLLRLIAGVTRPSEGSVRVRGTVAPLLSVGVGFHPEMTGRENVRINGMLLGLSHSEVDERFGDIVAFAELSEFIDTPVKFYSSGMFMRLAFSVAIHTAPDVFLLDEILAVGDLAFQLKCYDRMREVQRSGTTILVVSHSMNAIRLLCPRAIVLRRGELDFDGNIEQAVSRHHELLSMEPDIEGDHRHGAVVGGVVIESTKLLGPDGPTHHAAQDTPLRLLARLRFERPVDSPLVSFSVITETGTLAYQVTSAVGQEYQSYGVGDEAEVEIAFEPRLARGTFRLLLAVISNDHREIYVVQERGTLLYMAPRLGVIGIAALNASIAIDGRRVDDQTEPTLGAQFPEGDVWTTGLDS